MEAVGLVCFLGLTAIDDIKTKKIRVLKTLIFLVIGVLINIFNKPYSLPSVLGGMMIGIILYLLGIFSKEKIGKGDGLVVLVASLYLGFKNTLLLLWVSSIFAAIIGTFYIKRSGEKMDFELPFVPFMLMGYLVVYAVKTFGGLVV